MAQRVLPDHWPALFSLCIAAWVTPVHAPGLSSCLVKPSSFLFQEAILGHVRVSAEGMVAPPLQPCCAQEKLSLRWAPGQLWAPSGVPPAPSTVLAQSLLCKCQTLAADRRACLRHPSALARARKCDLTVSCLFRLAVWK